MRSRCRLSTYFLEGIAGLLIIVTAVTLAGSQAQKGVAPEQDKGTIRVKVGLVQTDVMVFDRQGHFVPDLKKEQFELRVDGKVQPIEFMEMVSSGSAHDREIWAKTEGRSGIEPAQMEANNDNPGRTLIIFLDDWHMAADSAMRARSAVANLLGTSMNPKDRVGIFSASGQLSAMQVLTNDKTALLALLDKYNFQSPGVQDLGSPPMTEAQALLIEQKDDSVMSYFIGAILRMPVSYEMGKCRPGPGSFPSPDFDGNCARAADQTRKRAAALAETSAAVSTRTLSTLRALLRAAEVVPGRKFVFFLSDGFVLQYKRSDIVARLTDLTTAAARAGIMVYTLDSRGLLTGMPDAKSGAAPDTTGARMSMAANEVSAPWDVLNALAADTGGRFLKNTNALDAALITTLAEISRYYLLAWPIDPEKLPPGKSQSIRVAIKGRSGLTVRVRQGAMDLSQLISQKGNKAESPDSSTNTDSRAEPQKPRSESEVYSAARSVVDLSHEELVQSYPTELRDLDFDAESEPLEVLLEKTGVRVKEFFDSFPNTLAKEQVRMERTDPSGKVEAAITRNYLYSFSLDKTGAYWTETRTEANGRPIDFTVIAGFFMTPGRAGLTAFLHPIHQKGSRFRYLGRQSSNSKPYVIAFAQIPEVGDYLGSYQSETMITPTLLLFQGLAWVDPDTYQILRMRTDLLAPRHDVGLARQTSEIWFSDVHFRSNAEAFWLPSEVLVTHSSMGRTYHNRSRYSDYQIFTVSVQEKIIPPQVKK
jgi:VWFA-related protein